jgi:hypothetical protein
MAAHICHIMQNRTAVVECDFTFGGAAVPQEVALLKGLSYDRNIVQFYGVCPQPGASRRCWSWSTWQV